MRPGLNGWNARRGFVTVAALLLFAAGAATQTPPTRPPEDRFITINGVRLHYLDWGGRGDVLLFLPGLGDTAHRFDTFAAQFTDRFHVLGLTRRGQGASDSPVSGYDTETLAGDVGRFLTALGIQRASIIGHSIAGLEMTSFAIAHPERVQTLVYLDPSIDPARANELAVAANLPQAPGQSDTVSAIDRESRQTHLDYGRVMCPALAFFVIFDAPPGGSTEAIRQWNLAAYRVFESSKREGIEMFRTKVRRGRVIEMRGTDHLFFVDPARTVEVAREIRAFLLTGER